MVSRLAQNLSEQKKAMTLFSSEGFYHNVTKQEVATLKELLFGVPHKPEAMRLAAAALLLLKFKGELNQSQNKLLSEELARGLKTSSFKNVVASLLIRIPHFSGFKHVIPHLEAQLVPEAAIVEVAPRLKQSSAALYEKQVARYRREWCTLSAAQDLSFAALSQSYESLKRQSSQWNYYEMCCQLETQTNFLVEKINRLGSQRLDINQLCNTLETLITGHPVDLQDVDEQHRQVFNDFRERLRLAALDILLALLSRLERRLLRRYSWLLLIHEYCLTNASSVGVLLRGLELTSRIVEVFGSGSLHLEGLLFTNENSLQKLLDYLFRRKPASTQPKQVHHYRIVKASTRQKTEKASLNLNTAENPYSEVLDLLKEGEQQQVVLKCLKVYRHYYSHPHSNTHTAKFMELFDFNLTRLNRHNQAMYCQIKELVFPKSIVFSRDVDHVYEELCQQRMLRRVNRNSIVQLQPITIQQEAAPVVTRPQPLKSSVLHIKKAASEDLQLGQHTELEGWGSTRKQQGGSTFKPAQQKPQQQPSEMFYSFHDSRTFREKEPEPVLPAADSGEYILTPSFE